MSRLERHRETRRYEFYRDGFRVMLPVFALLVVFATALSVALSMTVLKEERPVAYAAENGSITALTPYSNPRDPRLIQPEQPIQAAQPEN